MNNKLVSLIQLTNLKDDQELCESFVRYSTGMAEKHGYRHQEILDIAELLDNLNLSIDDCEGFIFGYLVPQLNKEFDLIKITKDYVLNIELKSQPKDEQGILKQLSQNNHYLKLFGKNVYCFTFVSSTNKLYKILDEELKEATFEELKILCSMEYVGDIDFDEIFAPKHILVSPLNDANRFLNGDYLLTENQENIKRRIFSKINDLKFPCFIGLTGGPGTGKTLLLYDIAKELSQTRKVLVVHSGMLCKGHNTLEEGIPNVKIIDAKKLRTCAINDVDYLLIDEAQRLYETTLDKVENWVIENEAFCLISYDPLQRLSHYENNSNTVDKITELCRDNTEKLTNKIRTNKEMSLFIRCLFDLKEIKKSNVSNCIKVFSCIKIFYEPRENEAIKLAEFLNNEGYQYIGFTTSYYVNELNYQKGEINTHSVIGQEFDKVCMIMDSHFFYKDNKLMARQHPNPDYIFTKLLYEGITRARSGLALIITDKDLFKNILSLFNKN